MLARSSNAREESSVSSLSVVRACRGLSKKSVARETTEKRIEELEQI